METSIVVQVLGLRLTTTPTLRMVDTVKAIFLIGGCSWGRGWAHVWASSVVVVYGSPYMTVARMPVLANGKRN